MNPKIRLHLKFGVEENIQKIKVGYLYEYEQTLWEYLDPALTLKVGQKYFFNGATVPLNNFLLEK